MEYDLKIRDLKLEEKNKGNRSALKERDDFKVKLENGQCFSTSKWSPNKQEMCHDKSCYRFGIESSNSMESNISFGDETLTDSAKVKRKSAFNSGIVNHSFENSPNHIVRTANLHERTFKHTQTHKPEGTQGSRETRRVWNNIQRVNHSNFSRNSRVKEGSMVGFLAVLPQTVKKSAMINPKQTWKPKGNYLDSVNRGQSRRRFQGLCYSLTVCSGTWILKIYYSLGESLVWLQRKQQDEAVLWHRRLGHVNFNKYSTSWLRKSCKGFRVYNRVTRKVQDCLHVNFLENQENQKGKGPDWMFDLDLLTPSMNYIPLSLCISEERTAAKEVPLSSEEQALHDELRKEENISIARKMNHVDSTFTLSTANTTSQSNGGVADYNNMDPTIDVPFTPTLRIHKIHPQSQIIGKSTAGDFKQEEKLQDKRSSPRDAQGTPTQSAAQASILQGTADFQGTAEAQGAADIPQSPNDYTPTDESQTSGGDEGLLDLYALNREVRRLKKQNISQAKQIHKLKAKLKKLSKGVKPLVKHHILWVKSQKLKKRGKKQKKKVSSVKLGRNKDEGNLSEEHHDQDDHNHTAFVYEDFDATDAVVAVTPDLERKSDETEQVIIEEEKDTSDVKSGDTEELDLERIQSTARQSAVTPRTLNFDDEAGPSSPIRPTQEEEPEEQFKDDEFLADIPLNISRPRGLSIPGPMQSQPQQPTQTTDPKEKGKGILVEEPKKKKLTLQQIRALETAHDEEVARKVQAEWDAEEERKRLEDLKKPKPKTISKKPTSLTQERNQMMSFLKGQGYKNLQKLRYPQMKELYDKVQESIKDSFKDFIPMGSEKEKQMLQERDAKRLLRKRKATVTEEQPSKKLKLRTEKIDELRNYLRIVDFEKSAQDRESLEAISMITEFKVIDSPDGEYLIIYRANNHFRAFNTLWEILHILDRQDLYHLYLVVQDYYKHIPPTGLGLILLGDLTTIWETSATSDDDFWKNQEDWEIIRWRLNESSGVHTLELEDGTMLHMLAERRYPLSRELMIRMLDHGMEVEDESETAITLIHLFILWTTEDGTKELRTTTLRVNGYLGKAHKNHLHDLSLLYQSDQQHAERSQTICIDAKDKEVSIFLHLSRRGNEEGLDPTSDRLKTCIDAEQRCSNHQETESQASRIQVRGGLLGNTKKKVKVLLSWNQVLPA
ncbi:hypothetical protein Tco_0352493 [Tanacetum coccineum]